MRMLAASSTVHSDDGCLTMESSRNIYFLIIHPHQNYKYILLVLVLNNKEV